MASNYLSHLAFKHFRALIVWAMMPLSAVNGQAIVGCGCTGHFETGCHCLACDSSTTSAEPAKHEPAKHLTRDCMASHSSDNHACCRAHDSASAATNDHQPSGTSETSGFKPHHCTNLVLRLGESVIAVSPQISDQVDLAIG